VQIEPVEPLKELAGEEGGLECVIRLKHGLISRKRIDYVQDRFYIFNYIDESEQFLTEEELMDSGHTNIGLAMKKGALIKEI